MAATKVGVRVPYHAQEMACPCIHTLSFGISLPGGFRLWMSFPVNRRNPNFFLFDMQSQNGVESTTLKKTLLYSFCGPYPFIITAFFYHENRFPQVASVIIVHFYGKMTLPKVSGE